MLALERKPGQRVILHANGERIVVQVVKVRYTGRGYKVKLGIEAPQSVLVLREELEDERELAKGGVDAA